jgi:hypothetical protein
MIQGTFKAFSGGTEEKHERLVRIDGLRAES